MPAAKTTLQDTRRAMIALSHELGRSDRQLAILAEGNTSARVSRGTFVVKASGFSLATLEKAGVTECRFDRLLPLLDARSMADSAVDRALLAARTDPDARKPSVEAIFHAYLLTLPGVNFVGHTHPVAVNKVLCSGGARAFASRRLFPDEVVCCGTESVFVPYTDPGLRLAQAIRRSVSAHIRRLAEVPKVILLQNHGFIALGSTQESVLAATLMGAKAAEIFAGASGIGRRPHFLTRAQVLRIAGRPDEHYRRRILGI
jgi:rhamnose utilization protein RhaD (predicted bifunctional aldolase and dehydrogenase)